MPDAPPRRDEPAGRELAIEWHGHAATAWLPAPLATRDLILDVAAVRTAERAVAEVRRVGDRLPAAWEPLARLLLRAEGIASSNIEGLRAPVGAVVAAEAGQHGAVPPAEAVADNLAVVSTVLEHAHDGRALDLADLHAWHAQLMTHGGLPSHLVGAFRDAQGWIGGRGPQDAAYVPPPPDAVPALVDDLISYVNRTSAVDDAVAQSAIAHAQFETIHPYGDGNGRLGRLLVLWTLARRLDVAVPPAVSTLIARDPGGYLSGLYRFRVGEVDPWVQWFADVVAGAARASLDWVAEIDAVLAAWRDRLRDLRADAAARRIIDVLPAYPLVSVDLVVEHVGVSATAARSAFDELTRRGILEEQPSASTGPGRPRRWWLARELVDLVGHWAG